MKTVTLPTTWYNEECVTCGEQIVALSPKRLAYLMKAHRTFKHETNRNDIPSLWGEDRE